MNLRIMDPVLVAFIVSAIVSAITFLIIVSLVKGKGPQSQSDRPSGPFSGSL